MVIFVGDKPSPKMKAGAAPFSGASCEKRLFNWIHRLALREYRIVNSDDESALKYALIYGAWHQAKIVALGNAAAFRLDKLAGKDGYFKLPHPSGRNRKLNDKTYVDKVLKECYDYLNSNPKLTLNLEE